MFDGSGRQVITYNGEIYNFKELRRELTALGYSFRSSSDTEVLLSGFGQWGTGVLDFLQGMYAFAIWDAATDTLFAARDRLGIKPLYYYWDGSTIIIASELRSILRHPRVAAQVEPDAIRDFLVYGYVPDPKSIFRNIFKLPAAHLLQLSGFSLSTASYWDPVFNEDESLTESEWMHEIQSQLKESVASHLVSDVPIGAFLSGGVDSSAVVSTMASLNGTRPTAVSIGFPGHREDELHYARRVSDVLGVQLHEKLVSSDDLSEGLDVLSETYDEPFADHSALPTYYLCRRCREDIKVALSGDGGDENFAGYRSYSQVQAWSSARKTIPFLPKSFFLSYYNGGVWWSTMLRRSLNALTTYVPAASVQIARQHAGSMHGTEYYMRRMGHWTPEEAARLLSARYVQEDPFWAYRAAMQEGLSDVNQALRLGLKVVLPGRMLTKVDRASMAHGLEVRVPFLDHRMVELTCRIPARIKLAGGETKHILKKSLADRLPEDILYRRKQGFTPPIRSWFRDPEVLRPLSNSILGNPFVREVINTRALKSFLQACATTDLSKRMWSLVILDRWSRRWLHV